MGDQDVLNVAMKMPQSFGAADWNTLASLLTEDTTFEAPTSQARGTEAIVKHFQDLKTGFPDMTGEVVNAIAMGNMAALELISTGTHTGPIHTPAGTMPPTGKRVQIKLAFFYEISDGKIVRIQEYFDPAGLRAQLGSGAPAPAPAEV